jgi:hypothetical protein
MTEENNDIIKYVSQVREIMEISEYMNDPILDEALGYVVRLSVKSTKEVIPAGAMTQLVVKLQSIAGQCSVKAKYYTIMEKGPEAAKKKNIYYTVAEVLDKIANALKYGAKNGS